MTDRTEQLEAWWSGLSTNQRARVRGQAFDSLDADLQTSLEDVGLVRPGKPEDKDEVDIFLKTRH